MKINAKHNFEARPCVLPDQVLNLVGEGVKRWEETGLSILKIFHRSIQFEGDIQKTKQLVWELLHVPDDYSVLFLQGEASMQFCMVPMPPVFFIYAAILNLHWLKSQGGMKSISQANRAKAQLLYEEINCNLMFYGTAKRRDWTLMNITSRMHDPENDPGFLACEEKKGMVGIKGYSTIGGFRASVYNALPIASVKALIASMKVYSEQKFHYPVY